MYERVRKHAFVLRIASHVETAGEQCFIPALLWTLPVVENIGYYIHSTRRRGRREASIFLALPMSLFYEMFLPFPTRSSVLFFAMYAVVRRPVPRSPNNLLRPNRKWFLTNPITGLPFE